MEILSKFGIGKNVAIFIAVVFGIVCSASLLFLYGLSETGLVRVPLMTSWFYSGPQPSRELQVEAIGVEDFKARLAQQATRQLMSGVSTVGIRVAEQDLTAVLQSSIPMGLKNQEVQIEKVQLAIQPDGLEFFGKLRQGRLRADVLVTFVPVIEDQQIHFEMRSVQLGDIQLSPSVAAQLASLFFSSDLGKWNLDTRDFQVKEVILKEGFLEIVAIPAMR